MYVGLYLAETADAELYIRGDAAELVQAALLAIVMADARSKTVLNRALSGRTLVFFGVISYSLYLFQFLSVFSIGGGSQLGQFTPVLLLPLLWNFAISLVLSTLFAFGCYSLIEVPARRWLRLRFRA